ncbi:hypothetical protein NW754_009306 [Fusarium falciforme]|nr:hypothetical protein NW754_009306 [Fusarium falciforme]
MRSHRASVPSGDKHSNISMRVDMVSRTSSDGPPPGVGRKWNSLINKIPRRGIKIISQHAPDTSTSDLGLNPKSPESHSANPLETQESNIRQLQSLIGRMPRNIPSSPDHVDAAYNDLRKVKEQCATLCRQILTDELRRARDVRGGGEALNRRDSSVESPPQSRSHIRYKEFL